MSRPGLEGALGALEDMVARSERALDKQGPGTASYSLLVNRNDALNVAIALTRQALEGPEAAPPLTRQALGHAKAPLASLLSKSEKAQAKLAEGWQRAMLERNITALRLVIPLLEAGLEAD